jgi:hypothetical protein
MKVNTLEQYKILEYLQSNFNLENFKLDLLSRNEIKILDNNNDFLIFKYDNGVIDHN